ncbi:MAG: hypothetical protein FWD17_01095 [Polyangiaceae bacterium]|nr:hypothetical protein [Polyangiaceae bacterium]
MHALRSTGISPAVSTWQNVRMMMHAVRLVLGWRIIGGAWPNPFFDRAHRPIRPVTVLTPAEREALRPLCGPSPSAPREQDTRAVG